MVGANAQAGAVVLRNASVAECRSLWGEVFGTLCNWGGVFWSFASWSFVSWIVMFWVGAHLGDEWQGRGGASRNAAAVKKVKRGCIKNGTGAVMGTPINPSAN